MTQSTTTPAPTTASSRSILRQASAPLRISWRMWLSWLLLLTIAIGLGMSESFGVHLTKGPVPLKRPLSQFSQLSLLPEFELHPRVPRVIGEDELQTLGTREYVTLRIVDRLKEPTDKTSVAEVFITYYTGKPDMVPHVPDECYLAGGFERIGSPYTQNFEVSGAGAVDDELPIRVIQFRARGGELGDIRKDLDFGIFYFFRTNDGYATTRNEVRLKLSNPFDEYAYYAKIEIRMMDHSLGNLATVEEAEPELPKVLRKLMPILLRDHFITLEEHAASQEETAPSS